MSALCECGCGKPAPIATKTSRGKGHVKGEPLRYVHGHGSKGRAFPERKKARPPIIRECKQCAIEFEAPFTNPSRKFCSPACYALAQQKRVQRVCGACGQTFEARESEVRRQGGRYCGRACWQTQAVSPAKSPVVRAKIAASKRGARNAAFKDGLEASTVRANGVNLKEKGESACRNCRTAPAIHLHHVIPRSMWKAGIRDIRNCIPLCGRCHLGWHQRYVTIYREIFTAEEWTCITSADLLGQNVIAWLDERYPARTPAEWRAA